MPTYKRHLVGALFFYTVALACLSLSYISCKTILQWFVATLAGALFPDIDIKSKGQQLFYKLFLALILTSILYNKLWHGISISVCAFFPLLVKHRGIFHNLWFLLALVSLCAYIVSAHWPGYTQLIISNALFFMLGIFSHLWLDKGLIRTLRWR